MKGRRLESDLVCPECERRLVVCEGYLDRVAAEGITLLGWRGSPGIDERPEPV